MPAQTRLRVSDFTPAIDAQNLEFAHRATGHGQAVSTIKHGTEVFDTWIVPNQQKLLDGFTLCCNSIKQGSRWRFINFVDKNPNSCFELQGTHKKFGCLGRTQRRTAEDSFRQVVAGFEPGRHYGRVSLATFIQWPFEITECVIGPTGLGMSEQCQFHGSTITLSVMAVASAKGLRGLVPRRLLH